MASLEENNTNWRRIGRLLGRLAGFLLLAFVIGVVLDRSVAALNRTQQPAGLGRGFLHGAMMPCAMPNLLIGKDIPIYAERNNGLPYKLGYTLGVNACGAIFFGFLYWRLNRFRQASRQRNARPESTLPASAKS